MVDEKVQTTCIHSIYKGMYKRTNNDIKATPYQCVYLQAISENRQLRAQSSLQISIFNFGTSLWDKKQILQNHGNKIMRQNQSSIVRGVFCGKVLLFIHPNII